MLSWFWYPSFKLFLVCKCILCLWLAAPLVARLLNSATKSRTRCTAGVEYINKLRTTPHVSHTHSATDIKSTPRIVRNCQQFSCAITAINSRLCRDETETAAQRGENMLMSHRATAMRAHENETTSLGIRQTCKVSNNNNNNQWWASTTQKVV